MLPTGSTLDDYIEWAMSTGSAVIGTYEDAIGAFAAKHAGPKKIGPIISDPSGRQRSERQLA